MKPRTAVSDILVRVDENTDCRIGIGEKNGGGPDFHGLQVRYMDGTFENVPFYSLLCWYVEGVSNLVFSEKGRSAESLVFSDKAMFDSFRRSPQAEMVRTSVLSDFERLIASWDVRFTPEIDASGRFTSRLVDERSAKEEGIQRLATAFLAVDSDAFRECRDIGIHIPRRAFENARFDVSEFFDFCPVVAEVGRYGLDDGIESSEALREWRHLSQSKVHPGLRPYLSVQSVLNGIRSRFGIVLERKESYPKVSESGNVDFDSFVPKVPALSLIESNVAIECGWSGMNADGKSDDGTVLRTDVYAFEHRGDLVRTDREKSEILELLPSLKVLELFHETRVGAGSDASGRESGIITMAERIIAEARRGYAHCV